jgi:hypothetical protein
VTLQRSDRRIDPQPKQHYPVETNFVRIKRSAVPYKYGGMTVVIVDSSFKISRNSLVSFTGIATAVALGVRSEGNA